MVRRGRSANLIVLVVVSALMATFMSPLVQAQSEDEGWPPFFGMREIDFSAYEIAFSSLTEDDVVRMEGLVLEKSISELGAAMHEGTLTSYELTLFFLHRIQLYDIDQINSIVDLNPGALDIARSLDEERAEGTVRGPLHGIPVVLKDNISTSSYLYTSAGAAALAYALADRDAFLVEQLRNAGAIILAKTNMTEWANWMHYTPANGFSAVGGQTISPYADWLDPSGSSTGAVVAVTDNFAALAIGTETIGSIISPASRASVVGFKPSLGLISRDMVIPITDEFDTPGPIGKSVEDVAIAMTVLASSLDATDVLSAAASSLTTLDFSEFLSPESLQGKRIGLVATDPLQTDEYQIDMYALWQDVALFESLGAEVVIIRPPEFPEYDWGILFSCDLREEVDKYLRKTRSDFSSLAEITQFNEENPGYIPYGQERFYEAAACPLSSEEITILGQQQRAAAAEYMAAVFADNAVDLLLTIDDMFALQYALGGNPAISVPRGLSDSGVPMGITLVAPYLMDRELLGYAFAFEQELPQRVPPALVLQSIGTDSLDPE